MRARGLVDLRNWAMLARVGVDAEGKQGYRCQMLRLMVLVLSLFGPVYGVGLRVVSYNVGAHFTDGGYPNYALGDPGTLDHEAVADVLGRIGADVIALQEVHAADVAGSPDDLDALAATLGCPYVHVASTSGSFDTSLRVVMLSRFPFIYAGDIRSPGGAKEITRHFPVVKVDVPGTSSDPVLISAHLKAGTSTADRFRRAIEMQRLVGYVESQIGGNLVIMGDFNPSGSARTFFELPNGLPGTYELADDVVFPVSYSTDMLSYFGGGRPVQLDPRQLNGSDGTFQFGQTLDLLLVSPEIAARGVETEIFNSALDVSNSGGLVKVGVPLSSGTSLDASDHYAVFADLELDDPVQLGPYVFEEAGAQIIEAFEGFGGDGDPGRWVIEGGVWQGIDDGSSLVVGARSYGTGEDGSLGYLTDGSAMVAEASFRNDSGETLTLLDVGYVAEQWRGAFGGSEDRIQVDLINKGEVQRLAELDFVAGTSWPDGALAGGRSEPQSTRVGGLSIPSGDAFSLRFTFTAGAGWGAPSDEVFINEFHYDNTGSDAGEFVEVAVGPGVSTGLSEIELLLYNGNNGAVYGSHSLDEFVAGEISSSGHQLFSKAIAGIQNGSPDGLALVVGGELVSFISYEGVMTATDGAAAGMVSTNIGVSQNGSDPVGESALGLTGLGGRAEEFSWTKFVDVDHSPGALNQGQDLVLPGLPPQGIAIDDLVVGFVPDADFDGIGDDLDLDDDNDSMPDLDEIAFGSDPKDASSRFAIVIEQNADGMEMIFDGAVGVVYRIEWCDDLRSWELLSTHTGSGSEMRIVLPESGSQGFFRVGAGS